MNEQDEIGPDLAPDYLTSVKEGGFYGWPYSYFGQHVDPRVQPQRPDLVANALVPDYSLSSVARGNPTGRSGSHDRIERIMPQAVPLRWVIAVGVVRAFPNLSPMVRLHHSVSTKTVLMLQNSRIPNSDTSRP